ncbi:hypothetical protein [Mesorhizobium sp. M5C.F.Ca.ET.164.01.1.1]|uniref:hypothetical protein n=1 Tax=Mesorhizobium sp. M5C.F.Ca.ET.164.01.1.1 TaxID=2563957 RepID=UPI001093FA9A|nr:hypothetical protein [Mesorhizobium sp. M5C.F.Ca.ET.164.01.1.1]TGT93873.1 hypothetical protein EN807_26860 [Mesorhizobium sp. M5C.F.Ca.ET.164.01.1.1]
MRAFNVCAPREVFCFFGSAFLAVWMTASAHADFWKDAVNVITDPLKLDAGTENLIHAVERADLMLKDLKKSLDESGKTIDKNIREYLVGVDSVIQKTFVRGELTISSAFKQVSDLEKRIMADAGRFVRCSAATAFDQMQVALAKALNTVGETRPRFVLLGYFELGAVELTPQDITNPIESYDRLKTAAFLRLNELEPSSEAKYVEFIYGDMQRVAELTKCHYEDVNDLSLRLQRDIYEYRRLHQVWAGLVQ